MADVEENGCLRRAKMSNIKDYLHVLSSQEKHARKKY